MKREDRERYAGTSRHDQAEEWLRSNDPDYGKSNSRSRKVGTIGRYVDSAGYVLVKVGEEHPLSQVGGYALEHRIVADRVALLKDGEIVHHRNGVRHDNAPENLEAMTRLEHQRIHAKARKSC